MMKTIQIADGKGGFAIPPMHGVVYNLASDYKRTTKVLGMVGLYTGQNYGTRR